jgi:5-methylcytosine-specific restriction endonuclease McrBC GTP-binding regulatory subunit McrB
MSLTFTEEEVKKLKEAILASDARRSMLIQKDLKKFLFSHFKPKVEKRQKTKPKEKKETKPKKDTRTTYKITKVSDGYDFPSSFYKKDKPIEAAEAALKGIMKKSKSKNFTFSIKNDKRSFNYRCKDGLLEVDK